jgi:hypothetical protein
VWALISPHQSSDQTSLCIAVVHDARRVNDDEVRVWAFDRVAHSVRHVLALDELNHINLEFVSFGRGSIPVDRLAAP